MERYRIKDNYTRFYLHYVESRRTAITKGLFKFSSLEQLKGWDSILGLQFENLVLNHVEDLFPHLGLGIRWYCPHRLICARPDSQAKDARLTFLFKPSAQRLWSR